MRPPKSFHLPNSKVSNMKRWRFLLLASAIVAIWIPSTCRAGLISATNFTGLTAGNSAGFDRVGNDGINDLTITYISGNLATLQFSTAITANNPPEIASQTVPWFLPAGVGTSVFQIDFATPLVAGDKLFFVDFDSLENYVLTASNGGSSVSTNGWTLSQFEGQSNSLSAAAWNSASGTLGVGFVPRTNPVDVITIDGTVDRLIYTVTNNFGAAGFNWATQESLSPVVPEPTSLAIFTIGCAGMGLCRWRRK